MANAGKDDNASQFFFTMEQTPELMNKHTIFGKVVGNTVYNMIKLQDGIILEDDRPEYPQKILKAQILNNPFPDIKPRQVIQMIKDDRDKKPKSKMKATKDFGLLSFGDEAEEDEEDVDDVTKMFTAKAGKSSHDLLQDPKLSSDIGSELKKDRSDSEEEEFVPEQRKKPEDVMDINSVKQKLSKKKDGGSSSSKKFKAQERTIYSDDEDDDMKSKERKRDEIRKQIKALKKEMKHSKDGMSKDGSKTSEDMRIKIKELTEEEKKNDMLLNFHREKEKYAEKKKKANPKKGSAREEMTLKLLAKFKDKMHAVKQDDAKDALAEEDEEAGTGWMANSLKFESDDPVLAKDASTKDDDWFDIYDPRNPMNKRRRGEDGKGGGGKKSRRH